MTTKIDKIDLHQCKAIRDAINAAVAPVAERLGVKIHAGAGTYDDFECSFKVKIVIEGGEAEAANFEQVCDLFYLKPEHFGATIRSGGRVFTLVGLKPSRPKYPVVAKDTANGKLYKMPESRIAHLQEGKPGQPTIKDFVPRPAGFQGAIGR